MVRIVNHSGAPRRHAAKRHSMNKAIDILGGMDAETFLRDYWQKAPLLIRQAIPDVGQPVDFAWLSELASRDDVESRLIEYRQDRWKVEHGPLSARRLAKLPDSDWTILVQSVNHHLPHIADILWRFDFLPYARLDDLMISYAPPGGTVGPHFDSYDVFLLQVGGRKRWQISGQEDVSLVDGAPLKILQRFDADQTWELGHGDMLYLPPKYAHYGVALEPGMTYSIGFRAPTRQEMVTQFLVYLQDRLCCDGMYADPDLAPIAEPGRIGADMVEQVSAMLQAIQWDRDTVTDFLGHYLTEPKAHVFYDAPEEELDEDEFAQALAENGLRLDLKSQILFTESGVYANGERLEITESDRPHWQALANRRRLAAGVYPDTLTEALYDGYLHGFWHVH